MSSIHARRRERWGRRERKEGRQEREKKRAWTHCQLSEAEREGNARRHGDDSLGVTHTRTQIDLKDKHVLFVIHGIYKPINIHSSLRCLTVHMRADINTDAPKHVFMFSQHKLQTLQHLRILKISEPDMQDAHIRTQTHTYAAEKLWWSWGHSRAGCLRESAEGEQR